MQSPIIGISVNYTSNDQIGLQSGLGFSGQHWQLVADDYIRAIEAAGGVPLIIPVVERSEHVERVLQKCDGLLITGGNDLDPQYYGENPKKGLGAIEPRRDAFDIETAAFALSRTGMPILGVCRGCQVLNVVADGSLYQDIYEQMSLTGNYTVSASPRTHPTQTTHIETESRMFDIFQTNTLRINSFNHQAIKDVGTGFRVTMTTIQDGLVEAIEKAGERFVVGVQWHPEMMVDAHSQYRSLFDAFVRACR